MPKATQQVHFRAQIRLSLPNSALSTTRRSLPPHSGRQCLSPKVCRAWGGAGLTSRQPQARAPTLLDRPRMEGAPKSETRWICLGGGTVEGFALYFM